MADQDILSLGIDTRPAEDGARRYARTIDEVTAASGKAASSTDDLESRFRGLAAGAAGAATIVGVQLSKSLTGFRALARGLTVELADLTARGVLGVSKGLHAMADSMRDANGDLTLMGRTTDVAATGLEKFARVAITVSNILFGMKLAAVGTATAIALLAHKAAAEFAPAWNRVRVTIGDSDADLNALRDQVSNLAGDLGATGVESANTFYEILGSLPQLLDEPARAMDILRVSLEAGATGFTDAATAAKAVSAVITAFGLEAEDARRVSDALFEAQGLGATTFGEIANSIGRVSGLTASLGLDFEDLLGIIATLTPTGISTAEAVTQIGGAISNIIKPSAEAVEAAKDLGIQFDAAALEAKGLNQFLTDIIATTQGQPDVLAKLFGGRQALALLVALADKTDELNEYTKEIANSAGTTAEAVDTMNDSWEAQKNLLKGSLSDALRTLGNQFEGFGVGALKAVNSVVSKLVDLEHASARVGDKLNRLFGSEGIDFLKNLFAGGGDLVPTVTVGELQPLGFALPPPRPRPAEPLGAAYSTQKIRDFEAAQKAAAISTFALTHDIDAYRQALANTEEAVNDLVLAEAERNRAAGEGADVINQILGLYNAETEAIREQERALKDLDAALSKIKYPTVAGAPGLPTLTPDMLEKVTPKGAPPTFAPPSSGGIPFSTISNVASTASMVGGPVGSLASSVSQVAGAFAVGGPLLGGIALAGTAFKGISGLFDDGKSALQEFVEAVQAANQALDAEFALLDIDDPRRRFELTLKKGQGLFAGTQYESLLQGLTPENIDEFIDKILNPEPGHAKLKLDTTSEMGRAFIDILLKLEGFGDQIERTTDGLRDLANVVTDVPKALNVALYRQIFGTGLPSDPNDPNNPENSGGSTSTPSGPTDTNGSIPNPGVTFTVEGDIVIQNNAGDSAEDLVVKIEKGVQRRWSRGESTYLPGTRISG